MAAWQPGSFQLLEDGGSPLPALGSDICLSHAVGPPGAVWETEASPATPSQLSLATDSEGI